MNGIIELPKPKPVEAPEVNGKPQPDALQILDRIGNMLKNNPGSLLPLAYLLNLRGKPYNLSDHFPFEAFFTRIMPRKSVWKCGRQVAKTTGMAASGVLRHACMPYFNSLYVTPLCTQIQRVSSEYFMPFINQSILKGCIIDDQCTQNVFRKTFANYSSMTFSFAFLDAERMRGISGDSLGIDETQDFDYDFIPVIMECLSASKYGIVTYTGTPKTLDNTIEALWQDSSQAEWVTKCSHCNRWNMAALHAQLSKMIGKKGVVCGYCSQSINPRYGHWYHTQPSKASSFVGRHVPQIVMPMHYENPEKWSELLLKMEGRGNYTRNKFVNEVLGESCDSSTSLVSITDIQKASTNGVNNLQAACERLRNCSIRVMSVDWGGGGEEGVSMTAIALLGRNGRTGVIECHYAEKLPLSTTRPDEIRALIEYFRMSGAQFFAHDYGGSGDVREAMLIQAGLPVDRIVGLLYTHSPTRHIIHHRPPQLGEIRGYHALDKTRSLVLQASCLKGGLISLPEYESSKQCTHDMLNLIEERREMPSAGDICLIRRRPKTSDDFAHALNFGSILIWHKEQNWPDISAANNFKLTEEQFRFASPPHIGNRAIHSKM